MVLRLIISIPTPRTWTQGIQWLYLFVANIVGFPATAILLVYLPSNTNFHGPEVDYNHIYSLIWSQGIQWFYWFVANTAGFQATAILIVYLLYSYHLRPRILKIFQKVNGHRPTDRRGMGDLEWMCTYPLQG